MTRWRLVPSFALPLLLCAARADEAELRCPSGTVLRQAGNEFACETPDGVGEGPFWEKFEDGSLRIHGTNRNGKAEGRWRAWHRSGERSIEASYRDGELVGSFETWDAQGRRLYAGTHDAQGEMHGVWKRWWPSGEVRARWEMRHGVAHGDVEAWWEDGGRKLEGSREEGRREGRWIWWDEHGDEIARCRYERDVAVEGRCGAGSL